MLCSSICGPFVLVLSAHVPAVWGVLACFTLAPQYRGTPGMVGFFPARSGAETEKRCHADVFSLGASKTMSTRSSIRSRSHPLACGSYSIDGVVYVQSQRIVGRTTLKDTQRSSFSTSSVKKIAAFPPSLVLFGRGFRVHTNPCFTRPTKKSFSPFAPCVTNRGQRRQQWQRRWRRRRWR